MEKRLSAVEACELVGEELGIERSCIRPCLDESDSRVCCLVHESWLQRYIAGVLSEEEPEHVSPWSPYEHQLILQPSHPEPVAPWIRISIQIIKKPIRKALLRKSFPDAFERGLDDAGKGTVLSFAELMQCVGVHNLRHSWDSALDSYPWAAHCVLPAPVEKTSDKNVLDEMLLHAYGLSARHLHSDPGSSEHGNFGSSAERDAFDDFKEESEGSPLSLIMKKNVVPFVCALEGQSAYFLIEPYYQHSLHNMVTFSPSVLSGSHMRPLFVIYELLHALHWYHSRGIAHGALTLHKIKVSKGLWIYLESPDFYHTCSSDLSLSEDEAVSCGNAATKPQLGLNESLTSEYTRDDLPNLVELWVHGKISNFDYLMALNFLVGRRLGDPNYHPVFPWVTDFSVRDGGYRDLKKSKFRLNKGDRQLDVTYKAALLDYQEGAPPHHVSDVLSDITYHVYLARRTPKSVLCDHVRSNWVPNEYPSSMERLYHWTPDECIPQFFSDANIFKSVHDDLPDLELPSWTTSAEEFIQWHRSILESEAVSANLHHWIDLTFGYKLAGKAAVRAKNVYLHLIDKHQSLSNHGVVQLFTEPHPERAQPRLPHSSTLFLGREHHEMVDGKVIRSLVRLSSEQSAEKSSALEDSVMSVESVNENDFLLGHQPKEKHGGEDQNSKAIVVPGKEAINEDDVSRGAQFEAIIIPTNYNPLEMLERFEALEKFKNQFGPRSVAAGSNEEEQPEEKTNFGKLVQADMVSLGCAIVEMLMPGKVQLSTCGLTGKERETAIVKLCETNSKPLPRFARAAVHTLFKGVCSSAEGDTVSHDGWLPPLTADLLLQPHLGLFPFPSYFKALHEFLAAFYHSARKADDNAHKSKQQDSLTFLRNEVGYTVEQVDIAASFLPDLLPIVDDEGIKLLLYHLEPLFICLQTRLHACTQLFDMLAQALGPNNTVKTFLKCLLSLFDSHALEIYEVITKQTFLSQIIVRFGLDGFLKHFISFVVDAVAFKSTMESKAGRGDGLSILSGEGVSSETPAPEMEYNAKDVALDMDDLDLPGNFLREGSEDRDVQIGLMNIEDLDTNGEFAVTRENLDQVGDDEIVDQVTLWPRGIIDEEGDGRLFQGHISDDDDDFPVTDETDDRRSSKVAGVDNTHDVVTQQRVADASFNVEDVFTSTSAGAGGADNIDTVYVGDQGPQSENDPASDSIKCQEQMPVEFEAIDGNVLARHLRQSEKEDVNVRNGDDELQEFDVSRAKENDISESLTEKTEYDIGVNNMLKGNVIRQEKPKDEEEVRGEFNDEDFRDEDPGEVTEDDNEEIEEGDGSGEDSLEQIRLPVDENVASEEDGEDSSGDNDLQSNAILDPEDEEATKDEPSAYEIRTFYNSTKSTNNHQENKAQKQHDELTPGTISGIAAESIVWLAPRLGPVLTSKYIASQLLTMLPHCYMGYVGSNDDDDDVKTVNDRNAKWLLFCLSNFCTLYGEAFMLNQYLPYINKTIRGVQTKVTQRGEASLAGVLSLLKYCIPYLSRDTLSSYTESELMTGVFQPVIRILSSYNLTFPGGVTARQAICRSYIDVLTVVCLKLERELARENMTAPLQQFFSCFELERMRTITRNEMEGKSSPVEHEAGFGSGEEFEGDSESRDKKDTSGVEENDGANETQEDLYNTPVYEELCQTFSAAIAHHAFVPLCGIMGSKYMETSLHNHDLIWNLCCSHDAQLSHPTCEDTRASEDEEEGEENGNHTGGVEVSEVDSAPGVGSRSLDNTTDERIQDKKGGKEGRKIRIKPKPPTWFISRKLSKAKDVPTNLPSSSSSDQYLRGSWLTHWENQLNEGDKNEHGMVRFYANAALFNLGVKGKIGSKFSLQQVKLQTFTGHSGPVRSVYVQDSEHCFLSASKDKTVKLWSLSNHGDGTAQSASSWTYNGHTRPVFHVGMVESVRQSVSCDGSLHLWDPVSGRCLGVFDQARNNPIAAMATLPAPSHCVVAAMAEGTARFLDVRQHSFVAEWKVTTSSVPGTVRDVCCSPDGRWIAFGFSTGVASVLDIRGGLLRSQRRAHTGDIFQVKAFSSTSFITSSVDSGLSLWKDDGLRLKAVKGPSDPLPSLLVWRDQVISASISGRIGVHSLQEDLSEDPYVSYKLSGDVFRGGITCLGYLPLNRLLLIGSDTGNIVLCS